MEGRGALAPALADIVEEDVDRSEFFRRCRMESFQHGSIGAVAGHGQHAVLRQVAEPFGKAGGVEVDCRDARAFRDKAPGRRRADAIAGAGDHGQLALETTRPCAHGLNPHNRQWNVRPPSTAMAVPVT